MATPEAAVEDEQEAGDDRDGILDQLEAGFDRDDDEWELLSLPEAQPPPPVDAGPEGPASISLCTQRSA